MAHPDWDLDPTFLTVNHGSYGATPRSVLAAQRAWQDRLERQPSRFFNTELPLLLRKAAEDLAGFLNAGADDVVFVDNATTGCNAVLRSLALKPGDDVVLLSHAYGAIRNTVRYVTEQSGARIAEARIPFPGPTPEAVTDAVAAALTPATRIAVIDHITSGSALVIPVKQIVELCHRAGVPVLIDGAHGPGQVDLDVSDIGADWYVGNCHKWLCAPKGCGFLHALRHDGIHPTVISHGYGKGLLAEFDWTGTTDSSRFLAVTDAIAFHQRLGGAKLRQRNKDLAAEGAAWVARRLNTDVGAPADISGKMAGAMATVRLPVADTSATNALAIRDALMKAGTDAPVHALDGALWLRLSAFAYNDMDDYRRLAELTAQVLAAR